MQTTVASSSYKIKLGAACRLSILKRIAKPEVEHEFSNHLKVIYSKATGNKNLEVRKHQRWCETIRYEAARAGQAGVIFGVKTFCIMSNCL